MTGLPKDYAARKALPLFDFYTKYFPLAQIEMVKVAVAGNDQHNPGEPLHWARGKSMDQLNTAFRHMIDHGLGEIYDASDIEAGRGEIMHLAKAMWRLGAAIQLLCEERDAKASALAPAPTKRAELAALVDIDVTLRAEPAFEAAKAWAHCKSARWAKLDHALGLVATDDQCTYDASEPPEMSASRAAFLAAWGEDEHPYNLSRTCLAEMLGVGASETYTVAAIKAVEWANARSDGWARLAHAVGVVDNGASSPILAALKAAWESP